jgi:hypothetical protein
MQLVIVLERGLIVMFGAHEVIYGRKQNLRKENDVHKTCVRKAEKL